MMKKVLAEYEKRFLKREISNDSTMLKDTVRADNLKFQANGAIKPYYGLTCMVRIDPSSKLFSKLLSYQHAIKAEFEKAGIGHFFSFLEPKSFHMTICDIVASSEPIHAKESMAYLDQIIRAFTDAPKIPAVNCRVQGIGFKSTISALVRFDKEEELNKVYRLEQTIKDATGVNVRCFSGHICLAYCVSPPREATHKVREILLTNKEALVSELIFSQFDVTCFADMNTYAPLLSINIEDNQIVRHPRMANSQKCYID